MTQPLTEATGLRLAKAMERIAHALDGKEVGAPDRGVIALNDWRSHCPGCGNLKGKRHGQGCRYIVRRGRHER